MHHRPRTATFRASCQRILVLLVIVAGGTLTSSRAAYAHAIVESTEPGIDQIVAKSPARLVMRFNERVEIAFGAIRVFDTEAQRVDEADAAHAPGESEAVEVGLRPNLSPGTYTVAWRVISADGHPVEEAFVFHVRAPGEQPEGIATEILGGEAGAARWTGSIFGVVRWVNFAGLLVLCGALIFLFAVWHRTRVARTVGDVVERVFFGRWRKLVVASWLAVLVATAASLVLQAAVAGELPVTKALAPSVLAEVARTRFGKVMLVKLALLVAAAVLWPRLRPKLTAPAPRSVGAAGRASPPSAWIAGATFVFVAGLLLTPGLSGHAGSTAPSAVNLTADAVHLVAAAAWIGGLVVLLVAAFPSVRALPKHKGVVALAPVVARFSNMAVVAVGSIVATGLYASWLQVRAVRALTGAAYGLVLLAKLAVFLPLVVLGAVNNRWTKPRIERAASQESSSSGALATLRRLVGVEVALALVVLALTAFLVNLPPARLEAGVSGPFIQDVRLGDDNLNVVVDPNEVGENAVHLTATTPRGAPLPVEEMRVLFRMPSEDVGPLIAKGVRVAPGHFIVQGRQLSLSGEWSLEVVARTGRFEEARTRVAVTVNP